MRPGQLEGREVIDTQAQILGEVCGIEMDVSTWKVTHICVALSKASIEALGYKKPFLGTVDVHLPVEAVKMVKDVVTLNKSIMEIKNLVELHK